jgi:hypothetical protein
VFNLTSGSIRMTEAPISRLRQRMIEDMTIRKFAPRTQEGYIRAVKGSAPSSAPRRIERVSRIYVAISYISSRAAPGRRRSTAP